MKYTIDRDEWWPVLSMENYGPEEDHVEIPDDVAARVKACFSEFDAVQKILDSFTRRDA